MMFRFLRRGFGNRGNTLILLLIFFFVGFLLHFKGNTQPVVKLWNEVKSVLLSDSGAYPEGAATRDLPQEESSQEEPTLASAIKSGDFVLPAKKNNGQLVRHSRFALLYSEPHEQAVWVAYVLTRGQIQGVPKRSRLFLPDAKVSTGSAVFSDYSYSGYDRGHLAPAADFRDAPKALQETFLMSNISPQNKAFNGGIWNDLERVVRIWANKYERVYVVTGPVLAPGLPAIGRYNRISVPEYFYKVVLYCNPPYIKGIAFLMKNEPSAERLSSFVVSIDSVERLTRIDFFPTLPNNTQKWIEARSNAKEWYRLR